MAYLTSDQQDSDFPFSKKARRRITDELHLNEFIISRILINLENIDSKGNKDKVLALPDLNTLQFNGLITELNVMKRR